jgi:hypothetical protein
MSGIRSGHPVLAPGVMEHSPGTALMGGTLAERHLQSVRALSSLSAAEALAYSAPDM